jgi:hypothetical protein
VLILGEHLWWNQPVGAAIVLSGVAVSQGLLSRKARGGLVSREAGGGPVSRDAGGGPVSREAGGGPERVA